MNHHDDLHDPLTLWRIIKNRNERLERADRWDENQTPDEVLVKCILMAVFKHRPNGDGRFDKIRKWVQVYREQFDYYRKHLKCDTHELACFILGMDAALEGFEELIRDMEKRL